MSSVEVRPFRRGDREQLTHLVTVHAGAVIPAMSASVNTVMSQLEREPAEPVVDPWVIERTTLVAEQRRRVVAAAHLLRYAADATVGEWYRDSAEIRWFLFRPEAPSWPASTEAADALIAACVAQLDRWGVSEQGADGALPVPGVYGVPEQWPHVRAVYERGGFVHEGRAEIVYVVNVDEIPRPSEAPIRGLTLRRSVGISGTRLSATLGDELVGYIEVESREDAGRLPQHGGWADIGNLQVAGSHRRHVVGAWLVAQAADLAPVRAARSSRRLRVARTAGLSGIPAEGWFSRAYTHPTWMASEATPVPTTESCPDRQTQQVQPSRARPHVTGSRTASGCAARRLRAGPSAWRP